MNAALKAAVARLNRLGRDGEPLLFLFDYELETPLVATSAEVGELSIRARADQLELSEAQSRFERRPLNANRKPIDLRPDPIDYATYAGQLHTLQQAQLEGRSFLGNLTCRTPIQPTASLDTIASAAVARYKLYWPGRLLSFSPEQFLSIDGNRITTSPMKGTIDAALPDAATMLLANQKEAAEHATTVDLLRNDLGRIARRVRVEAYRKVERISSLTPSGRRELLTTTTRIAAELDNEWPSRLGELLIELLPAGSICGAPKRETVAILRKIENRRRGYYCGVWGIFDGRRRLESGVLIRFISVEPDGSLCYHSGGGITLDSDPRAEYQEMIDKIYVPTD